MDSAETSVQAIQKIGPSCRQAERRALARVVNRKRLADTRRGARDENFQRQLILAGLLAPCLGDQLVGNLQLLVEILAADQVLAIDGGRSLTLKGG